MSWSVGFLRKWTPVIGFRASLELRRLVMHESAGGPPREFEVPMGRRAGGTMVLRVPGTDGYTFRDVFGKGIYDEAIKRVRACRRIVDIGANIGCATLRFAGLSPASRIASVEPVPETFRLLERNCAGLQAIGRVQLFHAAVWGHETELVMADADSTHCTRAEMREPTSGEAGSRIAGLPVPVIFDRAGFDLVDLVKIDVEGAEVSIFLGDTGWLNRVRAIAIEFHGGSRAESGFDAVVARHGFTVRDLGHGTIFAERPDA